MPLPNTGMNFTPFDTLPAASLDDLVENIEALAAGTGLNAGVVNYAALATGVELQTVSSSATAVATGTTIIPQDNTIPQITEGTEFMTVSITPKTTTSKLVIEVKALVALTNTGHAIGALFVGATANALAVDMQWNQTNEAQKLIVTAEMTSGTVSPLTFRFRAGANAANTITFNGNAGADIFGAIPKSTIRVTEYKA